MPPNCSVRLQRHLKTMLNSTTIGNNGAGARCGNVRGGTVGPTTITGPDDHEEELTK